MGAFTVNDRPVDKFFGRDILRMVVRQPFEVTGTVGKYDVDANVTGAESPVRPGPSGTASPEPSWKPIPLSGTSSRRKAS